MNLDRLRERTLARQFPRPHGTGPTAVADLIARIGPIQSQVPRAPFLALAARLPGVRYADIVTAFDAYRLIKNSTLRGTVHTVVADQFPLVDAVAQRTQNAKLRTVLGCDAATAVELRAETERFAADWRSRDQVVDRLHDWLAGRGATRAAAAVRTQSGANHVWAHPAVLRRPSDGRWERRTDTEHRTARSFLDLPVLAPEPALAELVRIHLRACGPLTRRDLAWWSGETLTRVDHAVAALGDEVVRADGELLDVADPPTGEPPAGVRLLPEFDALVCGYAPAGRVRFLTGAHLETIGDLRSGPYSPIVLIDGHAAGTWRLVTTGSRRHIEVRTARPLPVDRLADPVADLARALDLTVDDIHVK